MPGTRQQSLQIPKESSPEPGDRCHTCSSCYRFSNGSVCQACLKELECVLSRWEFRLCYSAKGQTSFQIRTRKLQGLDTCISQTGDDGHKGPGAATPGLASPGPLASRPSPRPVLGATPPAPCPVGSCTSSTDRKNLHRSPQCSVWLGSRHKRDRNYQKGRKSQTLQATGAQ